MPLKMHLWARALSAVTCALLLFSQPLHARSFDKEAMAKLLPAGCTPREDVDTWAASRSGLGPLMGSRNEITCREKEPAAIWPHANVPKPRWPKAQPVAHDFDLASATNNGDGSPSDRIGSAYFTHLCKTEAGAWFYRSEDGKPQPPSVINLRPRKDVTADTALMYDRYALEAPELLRSLRQQLLYGYKGERAYRDLRDPVTGKVPDDIYDREVDPATKKPIVWLRTEPPKAIEPIWFAWERTPGAITFVERPLLPAGQIPDEEVLYNAKGFKLLRFSYTPLEGLRTVKLANGREVLIRKSTPLPSQCTAENWRSQRDVLSQVDCVRKFGDQHPVVTPTNESQARYGYVWREVFRSEHDLRLGITGAEWMVVDMKTGETIALERAFAQTSPVKPYIPFRTSVRIDNAQYGCHGGKMMAKTGRYFFGAAVGATSANTNTQKVFEPIPISPRPEPGDVLETR
jgi:hypothetical protein